MYGPLLRSRVDRKVAGVCAAFARSYGWDVTIVRVVVLVVALTTGFGFLAYLVCWVAIPEEPFGAPYVQNYTAGYPPYPPPGYPPQPQPPAYPQEGPHNPPPTV